MPACAGGKLPMPAHPPCSSPLTSNLLSLARSQLQMQASRAGALDAGALAVVAVDVALVAIVLGVKGASTFSIAALVLLGLSFTLGAAAVRLAGTKATGPSIAAMSDARTDGDYRQLEDQLLRDLAADVAANKSTLARKAALFETALALMLLATTTATVGRL